MSEHIFIHAPRGTVLRISDKEDAKSGINYTILGWRVFLGEGRGLPYVLCSNGATMIIDVYSEELTKDYNLRTLKWQKKTFREVCRTLRIRLRRKVRKNEPQRVAEKASGSSS